MRIRKYSFIFLGLFLLGTAFYSDLASFDSTIFSAYEKKRLYAEKLLNQSSVKAGIEAKHFTHQKEIVQIKSGDNLNKILKGKGVEASLIYPALEAFRKHYDLRRLRPKHHVVLHFDVYDEPYEKIFVGFEYQPNVLESYIVSRIDEKNFTAEFVKTKLYKNYVQRSVEIENNIFQSGTKAQIPKSILNALLDTYKFEINFQKDLRSGDRFRVIYEEFRTEEGYLHKTGDLLYASLRVKGDMHTLYRYQKSNGHNDYYNHRGQSRQKGLLKRPVSGARLSSAYGFRWHPVLKHRRMHKGVDFAAPSGTPIYAAGEGRIIYAGRKGSYGNYIKIRHSGRLSTAYAHMRAFHKSIKKGMRVKQGQLIGYIGRTGRVSGAHLHYEVIKDGVQVNPLKFTLPPAETLHKREYDRFREHMHTLHMQYAEIITEDLFDASQLMLPEKRPIYLASER